MDTQIKMVRQLVFIKEQAQLLVKETSARLGKFFVFGSDVLISQWNANVTFSWTAAEAGLQDLSPDIMKKLMSLPLSSTTA